ncbi:MAG TPA: hypothetical protein DEB15_04285 [Pusillimonas sp.]|jgi:TRAP-type C4-dicarboxylate transport system permease small subunit|nr:hypothetical protein [Pusillimonas sp.]HCN73618.1 hypothetical protein [Pusillimonas sp.]|tara:strand:- start:81987 stop:82493 length:507 start_codon:yes stop_codon:yes gene_type:complete
MKVWIDRALLGLHLVGACFLIALTLLIMYDVLGRILFNRPFAGTAELVAVGLVLLTFLQTPYVIRHRQLLRVTFLLDRVPGAIRSQLNAFAYILGSAFFLAIAITSVEPSIVGWNTGEFFGNDAFRIPAWPLRFGTLVLWIISGFICIGFAVQGIQGKLKATDDELKD